jgi:hypothetical protein
MMLSTEATEEREARDLELQSELERVREVYLGGPESEKREAKAEYMANSATSTRVCSANVASTNAIHSSQRIYRARHCQPRVR